MLLGMSEFLQVGNIMVTTGPGMKKPEASGNPKDKLLHRNNSDGNIRAREYHQGFCHLFLDYVLGRKK